MLICCKLSILLIMLKTVVLLNIFVETMKQVFKDSMINIKFKRKVFLLNRDFCNIKKTIYCHI